MKLFVDEEFTGLHQHTSLLSLGIITEHGDQFYAEFTDYDRDQVDEWLRDNVISKMDYQDGGEIPRDSEEVDPHFGAFTWKTYGDTAHVKARLEAWLDAMQTAEEPFVLISDCQHYDIVLFMQLWGGAMNIPDSIYYIPFDISTMFFMEGIDPDINREEYAEVGGEVLEKHNALWDAVIIRRCFQKLVKPYARRGKWLDFVTRVYFFLTRERIDDHGELPDYLNYN